MPSDYDCYGACECGFSLDEALYMHSEMCSWLCSIDDKIDELKEIMMDKKIKEMQKGTEKLVKQESQLLKEDKKRDKVCTAGKEMMKNKK